MLLSLIQSGLPYDVGSIGVWEYEENQLLQTPAKKGIKSSLDPMPYFAMRPYTIRLSTSCRPKIARVSIGPPPTTISPPVKSYLLGEGVLFNSD